LGEERGRLKIGLKKVDKKVSKMYFLKEKIIKRFNLK